jgi:HNH endonuclease
LLIESLRKSAPFSCKGKISLVQIPAILSESRASQAFPVREKGSGFFPFLTSVQFDELPERRRKKIHIKPDSGCFLWTGALRVRGYGQIRIRGKGYLAHRVIYEHFNGPIAEGFDLHHRCHTPPCVNPDHLEPLPHAEHSRLQIAHNRLKTHCIHGHPFDEANTYLYDHGQRRACKTCKDLRRTKSPWGPGKYPNSIGMLNAQKTHCPKGHPYDETNTIFHAGSRMCRVCDNERKRRSYYQKKVRVS